MSSPPDLTHDAFISYKQDNNHLLDENNKGWVDNFHERLEVQLVELIGRKVEFWRDPMLGNGPLVESLRAKIGDTIALIAILSPGYVRSEWCMGELRHFCKTAAEKGGLNFNGKSRIFAVVKIPPDGGKYPDEVGNLVRYEFFAINKQKRPEEFRPDLGGSKDQRYWNTIADIAWDLKELLTETGRLTALVAPDSNILAESSSEISSDKKKSIYLAETTEDLAEQRRQIKEELKLHGYNVLPDQPLPYSAGAYSDEVKKNLARADASINLLGRTYGLIPDGGGDRSVLRLQLDVANDFADRNSGFKRLIWMPEGLETADVNLRQLVDQVKVLADPHKNIEFLQTSLEEFKTVMHTRLTAQTNGHSAKAAASAAPAGRLKVYLICDRRDVSDAKPLITYLRKERHYEVVLPEFEEIEGEMPLAEIHQQNLLECDGVIVYYGNGSSRWAAAKRSDIEKHAGLEKTEESPRNRPLRAKAFYVTQPFDELKDVFDTYTAHVIKHFEAFDPALLNDFIRDLEGGSDNQKGNDNV